jgi:hypothetical protein
MRTIPQFSPAVWLAGALLLLGGCDGCSGAPPGGIDAGGAAVCTADNDCVELGHVCLGGQCAVWTADGGPAVRPDAGTDGGPAPAGQLQALPSSFIEFGAQRIGTPVERTVTLRNAGDAPLTILQILLENSASQEFSATPIGGIGAELLPGDTLIVVVTHTPVQGLPAAGRLRVVHTADPGALFDIELFAEFKGDAAMNATADVEDLEEVVDALPLDAVAVGSSHARLLFIRNVGSSDSVLTLGDISVTPDNAGFSVSHGGAAARIVRSFLGGCPDGVESCPAGYEVCQQGVCLDGEGISPETFVVTVAFAPTAVGERSATLSIQHNAGGVDGQLNIALTGQGVEGALLVDPATVLFTNTFLGYAYERSATVENVGGAPVTVTELEVGGSDSPFEIAHTLALPHTLEPGETVPFTVHFTPVTEGQSLRTLHITSDAAASTTAELLGTARLPPSIVALDEALQTLDPASLSFGNTYTGTQRVQGVRLANLGPGVLWVTRLAIDGPQQSRFSISPTSLANALYPVSNLDSGSPSFMQPNAAIDVTYLPGSVSSTDDEATLIVESDDPEQPRLEIALRGRSVQPLLQVTPLAIDFGPVTVGGPSGQEIIEVRNTGFGPLTVQEIVAPANAVFQVNPQGALGAVLNQGDPPLVLTVTFTPTDSVSASGTVRVRANLGQPALFEQAISVGGGGAECPARPNASLTVDPGTGACLYSCNTGFHECGSQCLSNTSPDSCGTRCSPCDSRSNTLRGCTAATSTCTYQCAAQHYDLNNDMSVAQGVSSTGCEYLCDVATPGPEGCTGLDNDCNGVADDGLPGDQYEGAGYNGNDSCPARAILPNVVEGGQNTIGANIYPYPSIGGNDTDWYRVRVIEETGVCWPGSSETFCTTFRLHNMPANSDYDLSVRDSSCTGTQINGGVNGAGVSETLRVRFGGTCGFNDDRDFFIRVNRFSGGSCQNYSVTVEHRESNCVTPYYRIGQGWVY